MEPALAATAWDMDTYEIGTYGAGWFQVIITTRNGDRLIKDGFVSKPAAQRWADRHRDGKVIISKDRTVMRHRPRA
jgi:hypothetical protein